MLPKTHAAVSSLTVASAGLYLGIPPLELALWIALGTAAGVLVDVDHLFLAVLLNGRTDEVLQWTRKPVRAVLNPLDLLEDIDPERRIGPYRLVSHLAVLSASYYAYLSFPLLLPVVIGLVSHLAADVVHTFYQVRHHFKRL